MIRFLLLLLFAGLASGQSVLFEKDPATANSLGAGVSVLNETSAVLLRTTSAYDPLTDTISGAAIRRRRAQVIGTTSYNMDLIEKTQTSLLAAGTSERFDRWTAASGLTVTADTTAAPNGEVIAQTLTDPGASLSSAEQTITVANDSLVHVSSIYVLKTAGGTAPTFGVTMALSGGTPVTTNARINTDTGAQQYGSNANTTIEVSSAGTWYRIDVVVTNNTSGNTTLTLDVYPAAAAYGASVDDATATGIAKCTAAMLVKDAFTTSYISYRNLLLNSETFGTTWAPVRATITSDTTANPLTGLVTADTLVEDGTLANTHYVSQNFTKAAAAIQMTFSVYILQSGRTWAFVQCSDTGLTNGAGIYFDVANGAKGTAVALGVGWSLDSSNITAVGSWYRCDITVTTATSTTIRSEVMSATGDLLAIHNGNSAAALILFGGQLVYGAKPQNYWATSGNAGRRQADDLQSTLTVSTTTGTLIAVCRPYGWGGDTNTTWNALGAITTSNNAAIGRSTSTLTFMRRADAGGTETATITRTPFVNNTNNTAAFTWDATQIVGYDNGATNGTPDTTLTPPYVAVSALGIGESIVGVTNHFCGWVLGLYENRAWPPSSQQIFANGVAP